MPRIVKAKKKLGSGNILYKCRRCGEIIDSMHSPRLMEDIVAFIITGNQISPGNPIGDPITHHCKDDNLGIADMIGGQFDED